MLSDGEKEESAISWEDWERVEASWFDGKDEEEEEERGNEEDRIFIDDEVLLPKRKMHDDDDASLVKRFQC